MLCLKIKKSSLVGFNRDGEYIVNILKCIGSGSYGYIFLMDYNNYVMKILVDEEIEESLTDYDEISIIDKIIDNKGLEINNRKYAYGEIMTRGKENFVRKGSIFLNFNEKDEKNIKSSFISKNGRRRIFNLYQNNKVIIMPLFVSFYDYKKLANVYIKKEKILFIFINCLIKSVDELLEMGLINIDLKMNNIMIDENNKLKIIDFGMILNSDKLDKKMEHNIKYYIWPNNRNFTYSMIISYMISVFILEIIYENNVYEFHRDSSMINFCVNNFLNSSIYSSEFKELIKQSLIDGLDFNKFKEKFYLFGENERDIPNMYHIMLYNKGIKIF